MTASPDREHVAPAASTPADPSSTADRDSLELRLTELETRYTHLQRVAEDLGEVVLAQSKQIELLERKLERITNRTDELESSLDVPRRPEDERPPHY